MGLALSHISFLWTISATWKRPIPMSWIFFAFGHKFAEFISKYLVHELIGLYNYHGNDITWFFQGTIDLVTCNCFYLTHKKRNWKSLPDFFQVAIHLLFVHPQLKPRSYCVRRRKNASLVTSVRNRTMASSVIGERAGIRLSPPTGFFCFLQGLYFDLGLTKALRLAFTQS